MNRIDSYLSTSVATDPVPPYEAVGQELADEYLVSTAEHAIRGLCDVAVSDSANFHPWKVTTNPYNAHHKTHGVNGGESFDSSYDFERGITRLERVETGHGRDGDLVVRYSKLVIHEGVALFGTSDNVGVQDDDMRPLTVGKAQELVDFVTGVRQSNRKEFSTGGARPVHQAKGVGKRVLRWFVQPVGDGK